jgi:hypothetical protein
VPSNENNAWFWLIGNNCPLQKAHPFGGKLKAAIFISAKKGSGIFIIFVVINFFLL